ncbi:amino acid ABC transporter substrate-binding protein [Aquabacterium soli]|uniref:Amino acid ABC transporter substrate-binding protein n=1 Tax=Aquabacterium soli TaxID=2493092 RepID=A0A3R8S5J5_9BURK|nr:amino acid ABC transporter substrate-binding protein [Aquabacterium soli]
MKGTTTTLNAVAVANTSPINVGVLFSSEGTTAGIERSQLLGTLFAIHEINDAGGIDGRELVAVHRDPQSSLQRYQQLATQLVRDDGVHVIFGCYMSSTRKAVIPVVEKWNRLLFYPTLYEGFEFSNNVIYTGAAPNQNSVLLADYMTRHFGSRVYMVGSDYIYPYESNRLMSDFVLTRPGGTKVGERYVRLDATEKDFAPIIKDILDKQPDFIFSTVVGAGTRLLYQAYAEAGLDPRRMPIASLTTCEVEAAEMGVSVAQGHITAAPYFQSLDTALNHECLARFKARFGSEVQPNMCWEAAYFQVHLFANALRAAGSDQLDRLLPSLLGSELDAPQGRVRIDPANHHTRLYPRIGRVDAQGQYEVLAETAQGIEPDPYLVNHSVGEWNDPLVLKVLKGARHGRP